MQCSIFHTCGTFFSQTVRPILSHPGQAIQNLAASIFASFSRVSRRDLGLLTVSALTGGIVVALFMRTFSKPGTSSVTSRTAELPPQPRRAEAEAGATDGKTGVAAEKPKEPDEAEASSDGKTGVAAEKPKEPDEAEASSDGKTGVAAEKPKEPDEAEASSGGRRKEVPKESKAAKLERKAKD